MDVQNRRALKQMARSRLAGATYDPKKLALIHTGISVGVSLVIAFLGYYLDHWIAGTASGLSGMGTRRRCRDWQCRSGRSALYLWRCGFGGRNRCSPRI